MNTFIYFTSGAWSFKASAITADNLMENAVDGDITTVARFFFHL